MSCLQIFKAIFKLENLRRSEGNRGKLLRFNAHHDVRLPFFEQMLRILFKFQAGVEPYAFHQTGIGNRGLRHQWIRKI